MLLNLQISNIALIDFVEIEFNDGLNVLSGETGAGKSIIIDSLNFVLGGKADKNLIKSGTAKCFVSALFVDINPDVQACLSELDIIADGEVLLSRSLNIDGKGECRVNGSVVTLSMLKQVASVLMDIHGQHEHQKLLKEIFQLEIVDMFAGSNVKAIKQDLEGVLLQIAQIKKDIKEIGGNSVERANTIDFLKYQIAEIEGADLSVSEEENLQAQKLQMLNSGKIFEAISNSYNILSPEGDDISLVGKLSLILNNLKSIADCGENFKELSTRTNDILLEVEDLEEELDSLNVEETFSERELDKIEERLSLIKDLKRKYGSSIEEIFSFLNNAKIKLEKITNSEEELGILNKKMAVALDSGLNIAEKLTQERKICAKKLEKLIEAELESLGMIKARFEIEFLHLDNSSLGKNGLDAVEFMFSANIGFELKPLNKVISGGEMSRVSLAIKDIISSKDNIDAMVFDEIDTGISGKMGQIVAEKMANISRFKQVLVVSHLPQIVAMGDVNFLIEKNILNDKTMTSVRLIENEELINEIARLVGGKENSAYADLHASEMRNIAVAYKQSLSH